MNLNRGSEKKNNRDLPSHKAKRKLLVQTGILVSIVFLVIAALIGVRVRDYCMYLYVDAKEEMIDADLIRVGDGLFFENFYWGFLDYWEEHLDELGAIDVDEVVEFFEEAYSDEENIEKKDYSDPNIPKKDWIKMSKLEYLAAQNEVGIEKQDHGYEEVFLMSLEKEDYGLVLATGLDDEEGEEDTAAKTGEKDAREELQIGDVFDIGDVVGPEEIKESSENYEVPCWPILYEEPDTGEVYYMGIYPLNRNGEARVALIILHNMDSFTTGLNRSILILELLILGILGLAGGLLLLTLYRGAVRPVTRIQRNVRIYVEDKDNVEFSSNMSKVYARNEFGVLADDLSRLADELQDYSQKNIGLAEENAKNATELQLAAKMQSDMLPKSFPEHAQITVAASMTPAKDVGGDLYDVFMVDDDHIAFLIADVAGKGVPAALLGSAVQTIVKYHTVPGVKPSEILFALNNEVCAKELDSMFVTVWLGILNIRTGHMMTSNAGHEYPMFNTGGTYELFKDIHGMPAGSVEGLQYKDHDFWLKKNDRIFVYTDGAAEATNAREEMFETGGILKVLNEDPEREPAEVLKVMKERIDAFVGEAEQFDDLTMLCVRFNGTEG